MAWVEINVNNPQSKAAVQEQVLWLNSYICIKDNPVCWKHWIDKGLLTIEDLVNENGEPFNCNVLGVNWLELQQILQAIPPYWKLLLQEKAKGEEPQNLYKKLVKSSAVYREAYNLLIDDSNNFVKYGHRWVSLGLNVDFVKYQQVFQDLHSVIKVSKLRDFQYQLLLNKITTNCDLKKWKLRETDSCTLCEQYPETALHLFYQCMHVQPIIQKIINMSNENAQNTVATVEAFIFNQVATPRNHIVNFLTVFTKQYVYCKCCNGLRLNITNW